MTLFIETLTDSDGDECRFMYYDQPDSTSGVYVQASAEGEVISAGPFTPEALRAALDAVVPAGSYTRTDEEDWQARAEKAEQERDEARGALRARLGMSAQPRALTADDITDEMVNRARKAWNLSAAIGNDLWRDTLTAALAEPTRPEGAEELARLIATADVGEWDCGDLADALLATGRVRVVTEEQP
ncbi:hypothetical protein [Brachybacterium massiliense]|uniref:hypothetical protein n=1 Tax=Brachybacterium massiliense TaxID=1755098 RepID=UPI000B3BC180|nr:hypothetical protein [Brachybacterium massiliense]